MRRAVPWLLLGLGVLSLGAGIYFEQWRVVLTRAVNICLTCIGIG